MFKRSPGETGGVRVFENPRWRKRTAFELSNASPKQKVELFELSNGLPNQKVNVFEYSNGFPGQKESFSSCRTASLSEKRAFRVFERLKDKGGDK